MMKIEAPYPDTKYILSLPNPNLANTQAQISSLTVKRMMNSSIHTYINKRIGKTYKYNFILTRLKALEYLEFMKIFSGVKIRINNTIICNILTNPTELEMQQRAVSFGSQEDIDISLSVEEI